MIATRLRQIAAGRDAEFDAEMLQQDRHEIRNHHDREERVTELRAAGEIGRPVAGVHVSDRNEKTGAGEGSQFSPEGSARRDDDAAVDFGQRDLPAAPTPGARYFDRGSIIIGRRWRH